MSQLITFIPKGTCSRKIDIEIKNDVIKSVKFDGGCPGNLLGITRLVAGMDLAEVLEKFEGLKCGSRETSCPDQLAKALRQYQDSKDSVHDELAVEPQPEPVG